MRWKRAALVGSGVVLALGLGLALWFAGGAPEPPEGPQRPATRSVAAPAPAPVAEAAPVEVAELLAAAEEDGGYALRCGGVPEGLRRPPVDEDGVFEGVVEAASGRRWLWHPEHPGVGVDVVWSGALPGRVNGCTIEAASPVEVRVPVGLGEGRTPMVVSVCGVPAAADGEGVWVAEVSAGALPCFVSAGGLDAAFTGFRAKRWITEAGEQGLGEGDLEAPGEGATD